MAITGGDVLTVKYNNDNVGEGVFKVKAKEAFSFDEGGFRNEDTDSMSGDGQKIYEKVQVPWMLEGTLVWDMITDNDLEKLVSIAEDLNETQFTVRHINGTIWGGQGSILGDIKGDSKDSVIPIKMSGGGRMKKVQ